MKRAALTFDDGPSQWTVPILDLLAEHDAHATFFVLGTHAVDNREILARTIAEGHEVGPHGWDHKPVDDLSYQQVLGRLSNTCEQLMLAGATKVRWWRPPWNRITLQAAEAAETLGLHYCAVTLNGRDVSRDANAIASTVYRQITDGSIVGLHDGVANNGEQKVTHRKNTVRAVEQILSALKYEYRFVTVSELLG